MVLGWSLFPRGSREEAACRGLRERTGRLCGTIRQWLIAERKAGELSECSRRLWGNAAPTPLECERTQMTRSEATASDNAASWRANADSPRLGHVAFTPWCEFFQALCNRALSLMPPCTFADNTPKCRYPVALAATASIATTSSVVFTSAKRRSMVFSSASWVSRFTSATASWIRIMR